MPSITRFSILAFACAGAAASAQVTSTPKMATPNLGNAHIATNATATVPLQISVSGDGAVRWGPHICAPGAGKNSALCNRTTPKGQQVILQAMPANGMKLASWSGACAGQGIRCMLTPGGPVITAAVFAVPPQQAMTTVKVEIPAGGGKVGPDPFTGGPINCTHQLSGYYGGTCQASVAVGSQMILVATAEPKAEFAGWKSDQAGCSAQNCAFAVTGPTTVTAVFDAPQAKAKMGTFTVSYERTKWFNYMFTTNPNLPMSCGDALVPGDNPSGPVYISTCKITQPIGTVFDIYAKEGVNAQGGGISDVTGGWGGACKSAAGAVCHVAINGDATATLGGDLYGVQ